MASRGGARGGKGKRARVSGSSSSIPPIPGFEDVAFATQNQRNRFMKLIGTPLNPTRFLNINAMVTLGLDSMMRSLFVGTGLGGLYGMQELTYYTLTLEFLSSLKMDKDTYGLSFRIQNEDYSLTLAEFGNHLSLGRSLIWRAPEDFSGHVLWSCISNKPLTRGFTNARVNHIEHPALRLWFRTVIGTVFGRSEVGTFNFSELSILGSFLNVQRGDRFALDLPYLVAKHMVDVAESRIKTIEIGGLITFLVKAMGFYCEDLTPVDAAEKWIDCAYLRAQHHWLHKDTRLNRWKVTKGPPERYIILPSNQLPALYTLRAGVGEGLPSYLIPDDGNVQNMLIERSQPRRRAREEASSSNPPPTQQEREMAHFNFQNQQFAHYAANQYLAANGPYHRDVESGLQHPPHPTYYRGGSTSGIFEETGIDPNVWNPSFHESYGGFSGQFLDEFGMMNLGGSSYGGDGYGGSNDDSGNEDDE